MLVQLNDFRPGNSRLDNHFGELNRLAEQFFSASPFAHNNLWSSWELPTKAEFRFSIQEEKDHYELTADTPGLQSEDIEIQATSERLMVRLKQSETEREGYTPILTERASLDIEKSFRLPKHVDAQNVDATLQDGVLTVKVYKVPEVHSRKVEISVS